MSTARSVLLGLLLLHSPDGREIYIRPDSVTTMRAAVSGHKNKLVTDTARCVLHTTDGKFSSVRETCQMVRALFQDQR
jgi:hypothetical protein